LSMVYQSEKLIRSQSRPGSSFVSLLAERPLRKGPKLRVGSWYSFFAYSLILARFLHHFPQNVDPGALASAMSHVELSSDGSAQYSPGRLTPQPVDDFPDLYAARLGRPSRFDPSRNRFANAVKRAAPAAIPTVHVTGARQSSGMHQGPHSPEMESRTSALVVPRTSQRIKLRPPMLLPTLRTGSSVNEQYMSTRATSIRLGQARNACLARAADAFRRGDGAAAKRFSREGKSLNERMLNGGRRRRKQSGNEILHGATILAIELDAGGSVLKGWGLSWASRRRDRYLAESSFRRMRGRSVFWICTRCMGVKGRTSSGSS